MTAVAPWRHGWRRGAVALCRCVAVSLSDAYRRRGSFFHMKSGKPSGALGRHHAKVELLAPRREQDSLVVRLALVAAPKVRAPGLGVVLLDLQRQPDLRGRAGLCIAGNHVPDQYCLGFVDNKIALPNVVAQRGEPPIHVHLDLDLPLTNCARACLKICHSPDGSGIQGGSVSSEFVGRSIRTIPSSMRQFSKTCVR